MIFVEIGNFGFKEYDCGDCEVGLDYLCQVECGLCECFGVDNVVVYSFCYVLVCVFVDEGCYEEGLWMVDGLSVEVLIVGDFMLGWE